MEVPCLKFKVTAELLYLPALDQVPQTVPIRNYCFPHWMDSQGGFNHRLNNYFAMRAKAFSFAKKLYNMARQSAAERVWAAIRPCFDTCKKLILGVQSRRETSCSH